ncbi:MAG: hypothetical protein HZC40_11475 [Chloroflexi bacterium]|nr:hypothetical protein [Chloroflexota bacterium]
MTQTRAEMFHKNLGLTRQHLLDVLAHPERFDWIPDNAYVIGLPKNDRALFEANMKLAHRLALKGDGRPIILIPEMAHRVVARKLRARVA